MLFLGGVVVGILLSVGMAITSFIVWKKFVKTKVDDAIFKAGLKAIEKSKEKDS